MLTAALLVSCSGVVPFKQKGSDRVSALAELLCYLVNPALSILRSRFNHDPNRPPPPAAPRHRSSSRASVDLKSAVGRGLRVRRGTETIENLAAETGIRSGLLEDCGVVSVLKVEPNPAFISV